MRWFWPLALALMPASAFAQQPCGGVERWAVKMAADNAAGLIDTNPGNATATTIHQLTTLPHAAPIPSNDTTRLPEERTVYVVDGRLVKFKLESGRDGDQDYHLVVSDDTLSFASGSNNPGSSHSFIAEIPNPLCVSGRNSTVTSPSVLAAQLQTARAQLEQQFPSRSGGWNDTGGIPVRVTGVAFFDRPHGQTGRASNGIELHPVLDITFNPTTPVTPPGGGPPPVTALANPGFELGSQGWTSTSGVITDSEQEPARTGTWKAWLGGYGSPRTDTVCRQIAILSTATTATMSFFLHTSTEEQTTSQAYDTLQVQVRNTSNTVLQILATLSNLQAQPGFQLRTYNVGAFRGQTIKFCLRAREDAGSMTSFVADDFGFVVE